MIKALTKPSKKIIIKATASYHFNFVSKKVSWNGFLDWVSENIPHNAQDVTIELMEHKYVADGDEVWLEFSWDKKIKNKHYDKQLKKYKKDLAKYKGKEK